MKKYILCLFVSCVAVVQAESITVRVKDDSALDELKRIIQANQSDVTNEERFIEVDVEKKLFDRLMLNKTFREYCQAVTPPGQGYMQIGSYENPKCICKTIPGGQMKRCALYVKEGLPLVPSNEAVIL